MHKARDIEGDERPHARQGGPRESRARMTATSTHGLDGFFEQVTRHRLLTAAEEIELAQTVEAGRHAAEMLARGDHSPAQRARLEETVDAGRHAFNRFVASNLRLVVKLAGQEARRSPMSFDDLVQEGCVGLIRAVEGFDWRRGHRFSTYAAWWIRQTLNRGTYRGERLIRIPVTAHDALRRIHAATSRLAAEGNRDPDVATLAEATDLSPHMVRRALDIEYATDSLDRPRGQADDAGPFHERVAVAADDPEEEAVRRADARAVIELAHATLDTRAFEVLMRRVGLYDGEPQSPTRIATVLGVSRETVRLAFNRAIQELVSRLGVR